MEAPVCRVCGAKHWTQQPHVWMAAPKALLVEPPKTDNAKNAARQQRWRDAHKELNRARQRAHYASRKTKVS